MPETTQLTLPVLPLRNGVVFPRMVVTVRVETEEGRAAIAAASESGDRLLLVPRIEGRYGTVGTIAEIQQINDGNVAISGIARARVGAGSTDGDGTLWVEAEPYPEADMVDDELEGLIEEYRAVVGEVLELRGMRGIAERIRAMDNPSRLADLAAFEPDAVEFKRTSDVDISRRVGRRRRRR